jgi:hypothetical protein
MNIYIKVLLDNERAKSYLLKALVFLKNCKFKRKNKSFIIGLKHSIHIYSSQAISLISFYFSCFFVSGPNLDGWYANFILVINYK